MRLGLSGRVYALVGTSLLVAGASVGILAWQLGRVQDGYTALLTGPLEARDATRALQTVHKAEVVAWKNILLRGTTSEDRATYHAVLLKEQEAVHEGAHRIRARLSDVRSLALLDEFEDAHEAHAGNYRRAFDAFEASGGTDAGGADAIVRGKNATATGSLGKLASLIDEEVRVARAAQDRQVRWMRWAAVVVLLVSCGGFLVAARWLSRSVSRPVIHVCEELEGGASRVLASATHYATSAGTLARDAATQAAELEHTATSIAGIADMTRRTSAHVAEVSVVATNVGHLGRDACTALDGLQAAMTRLQQSTARVAATVKTIDEIASQTNILALNAAVEAARAGDAGLGFAVVAGEVRELAQRAARASQDTASIIEQSLRDSREGCGRMAGVTDAIRTIAQRVSTVQGLVAAVNAANEQQLRSVEVVSTALAHMGDATNGNANRARENASSSKGLSEQAVLTSEAVQKLRMVIDGDSRRGVGPDPPHNNRSSAADEAGRETQNAAHAERGARPIARFPDTSRVAGLSRRRSGG